MALRKVVCKGVDSIRASECRVEEVGCCEHDNEV